jgi:hypothetical protein
VGASADGAVDCSGILKDLALEWVERRNVGFAFVGTVEGDECSQGKGIDDCAHDGMLLDVQQGEELCCRIL